MIGSKQIYGAIRTVPARVGAGGLVFAVLAVLAGVSSGCATLVVWSMADPHSLVKAQHKLGDGKLAVLIDDYLAPLENPQLKRVITKQIAEELAAANLKISVIPYHRVAAVRQEDTIGKKLSVQRIGMRVGAHEVVYINIVQFDLYDSPDDPVLRPNMMGYVKVIDVGSGERLWPVQSSGQRISHRDRLLGTIDVSTSQREKLWDQLARDLGHKVAVLFYDHREEAGSARRQ